MEEVVHIVFLSNEHHDQDVRLGVVGVNAANSAAAEEEALELVKRFGFDDLMGVNGSVSRRYSDEWLGVLNSTAPWLGSVSIDAFIVHGNTSAMLPGRAQHLRDGEHVTLIILASEGSRHRVLSLPLSRGLAPVDGNYMSAGFLMENGRLAAGSSLAQAILTSFP